LTVEGYLTLPVGKENAKGLPLVVNPHGGPWARDIWGYSPEIQFLASRGYAVMQMNFRGSTGYGKKFWQSSFKQWGQKMQDDITDGVNWAIEQNITAKDKICIYGGSYGGYATLAGLAFTPDLYKCGVDYVGVSNLFTFQETIPPYWEPYKKMLHEMVGHPEKDKEMLKKASPVFHVDKIKAALFVAQGANDPYMVKDNEGHGFHNEENQFEFYGKMEAFLKKHIQ
jgi:dipeptidyl aminopeptidase/acylaminoacyl peptidase